MQLLKQEKSELSKGVQVALRYYQTLAHLFSQTNEQKLWVHLVRVRSQSSHVTNKSRERLRQMLCGREIICNCYGLNEGSVCWRTQPPVKSDNDSTTTPSILGCYKSLGGSARSARLCSWLLACPLYSLVSVTAAPIALDYFFAKQVRRDPS